MLRILARFWRIPLRYAILVALPLQMLVVWAALRGYDAYARLRDYESGFFSAAPPPFHVEQWRYFARDQYRKDLCALLAPAMPADDGLETFSLSVTHDSLASLNADLPKSGSAADHPALLEAGDDKMLVMARYMGENHWHWLFPQKSWRIKTKAGNPFRDRRAFNLRNAPSRLVIDETLITRLSREIGVLSPEVEPVKFLLNGTYGGLYLRWDLADETLVRRAGRMPGSIYQGESGPPDAEGVSSLFRSARYWQKAASRNAEQAANQADIAAFIAAIDGDPVEFRAFVDRHFDMRAFAGYIAIDRLFGGRHHDYNRNHRIYFDPYKGRFEPIQWNFGDWHHAYTQRSFDATEQPLSTALKRHPDVELLLQQRLFELTRLLPPAELERRLDELVAAIAPALLADVQRDACNWTAMDELELHAVPSVHVGQEEFLTELQNRKAGFRQLHAGASRDLENSRCDYVFTAGPVGQLDLASIGHVAQDWSGLSVRGQGDFALFQDTNLDGRLDDQDRMVAQARLAGEPVRIGLRERLYPGLRKVPTVNDRVLLHGRFDLAPTPLHYRYFLRCDGRVDEVAGFELKNAVTGSPVTARAVASLPPSVEPWSVHPWRIPPRPPVATVTFGPGVVEILETRRFEREIEVRFAPGTTVRLGPGVSLLCFGKLVAAGTAAAPIAFEPLEPGKPWGGLVLHGQGTAGSRLSHCSWRDGSIAQHDLMTRTGMVSIIDSHDIVLEHSHVGANHVGDDGMHWGYVTDGEIRDCRFEGARMDALDLDICERVRILRCEFAHSGNDGADLMVSKVEIADCRFTRNGDKGVSVGEGGRLRLARSRFSGCVTGIEIKDSSVAVVDATSSIDGCQTGINLYRKNLGYSHGGTLQAESLDITNSVKAAVSHDPLSTVPANLQQLLGRGGNP